MRLSGKNLKGACGHGRSVMPYALSWSDYVRRIPEGIVLHDPRTPAAQPAKAALSGYILSRTWTTCGMLPQWKS